MPSESTGRKHVGHLGLKASTGGNHRVASSYTTREGRSLRKIGRRQSEDPKGKGAASHEVDQD
jgi:hypothetical protein